VRENFYSCDECKEKTGVLAYGVNVRSQPIMVASDHEQTIQIAEVSLINAAAFENFDYVYCSERDLIKGLRKHIGELNYGIKLIAV